MSETDCLLIVRALKRNLAIQFTPAPGREAEVAKWPPVLFFGVSPAQLPARQNSFDATGQALRLRRPVRTYFWLSK